MAKNILTAENIKKLYGDKELFDSISVGISEGEKIGIIGINGTGKTTLLKILAGIEEPDEGTVTTRRDLKVAWLPQLPEFPAGITLLDYVTNGQDEADAKSILTRLGFTDMSITTDHLSGGEKKRAALARTLITPADVLILDEPTNHIDSETVLWLENWLEKYRGVLIMVTHDRYFLDQVTTRILEIDQGRLYSYDTNYSGYLEKREERIRTSLAADQKRANILRTELAWLHRGARARSTKQKAHIQRIEEMQAVKNTVLDRQIEISSVASRMGKKTIEIQNVSKAYGEHTLFHDFSYTILKEDRIGIIGPNGCGKTTLIKVITGQIAPDSGSVTTGETIRIGYFAQENEGMDAAAQTTASRPDGTRVIDYVRDVAEVIRTTSGVITASQMLERFLFPPALQYSPISKLSGGEKRRLYLLRVLMSAPNVLILDEPTNDLDISTLEVLEDYLDHFEGIVICVSHDRFFLDRTVNRIFAFEDTRITQYEGGYTDYFLSPRRPDPLDDKKEKEPGHSTASEKNAEPRKRPSEKLRFTYKEQQEYNTIDADIEALETRLEEIEQEMAQNASDYAKLAELETEKETCTAKLEEKMDRWVYLNELAEKIYNKKS